MTTWLELINSIPGLAKAVANLIGDVSKVGSSAAQLASTSIDEKRRGIEDRTEQNTALSEAATESKVAMMKAFTNASVQYIEANAQQIGERALTHGVERLIREQNNREAVVMKTIEYLKDDSPTDRPTDTPSDDWLNLFGRYAENATSEKLREHWAQILSGEIRKPGSFSFATLLLASILDERLATSIEKVRPWIISQCYIPRSNLFEKDEGYDTLLALDAAGFLDLGDHGFYVEIDESHEAVFETQKALIIVSLEQLGSSPALPTAVITRSGIELLSALPAVEDAPELPEAIKSLLLEGGWKNVRIEPKDRHSSSTGDATDSRE